MEQQTIRVQMPDGKIAEFPVGMTPEQIEQAIKTTTAQTPFNPPRVIPARQNAKIQAEQGRMTPEQIAKSKQSGMGLLPMAGAVAGTVLTGGAGLPAVLAAAGGAGVGQAVKDTQWSMPVSQRVTNVAKSAGGAAITQGIGEALAAVAPHVAQGAKNLWLRGAKVPAGVAKTTETARLGGSIPAAEQEIAETVLEQGTGTLGRANLDKMRESLQAMDDKIDEIIASSNAFINRNDIVNALKFKQGAIGHGTLAQKQEQQALDAAISELRKLPPRIPIQQAQKVKRTIYQTRNYVADSKDAAAAMADKTTGRALRRDIALAEPDVMPINDQMTRQIPATKAMEAAATRMQHANLSNLSTMLAGMVTNPFTVASALLNHPKVASFSAQRIYNVAKMLPAANRTVPNILRALQLLGKDDE